MYPPNLPPSRNKLIVITALITMVITSILWVGIGVTGYFLAFNEPPHFQIQVDHPETIELGETFEIKVSIENSGADDINLANVDIYDDFMDGFEILDVSPKPSSSERLMGYKSYNVIKNLAPGDTHNLTFRMRAKEIGLWGGDIDACNTLQNMVTYYTEIEVVDAQKVEN